MTHRIQYSIFVNRTLRRAHPLVIKSLNLLKIKGKKADDILDDSSSGDCLTIRVTKSQLKRALRIMDAILKSLEEYGHSVQVSNGLTKAKIFDFNIQFGLSEIFDSVYVESPYDEFKEKYMDNFKSKYNRDNYEYYSSGKLHLKIEGGIYTYNSGFRRNWRETKVSAQ